MKNMKLAIFGKFSTKVAVRRKLVEFPYVFCFFHFLFNKGLRGMTIF